MRPLPRWSWALLAILVAAAMLHLGQHPLRLPSRGPQGAAVLPLRDRGHAILLVVDEGLFPGASGARAPAAANADLEWDNVLRQRFGGCDLIATRELDADPAAALAGRRLVVLPRATFARLPLTLAAALERAMAEHGTLVLAETPDSTWARQLGLRAPTIEHRRFLLWPQPAPAAGLQGPVLPPAPRRIELPHDAWRYAPEPRSIRDRTVPALSVAGRPELWRRPRGEGAWLILAVDLGSLAHRLRQGRPVDDLPGHGREGRRDPVTADLRASEDLEGARHPWLDAWVLALLDDAVASTPWPSLDRAPAGSEGWLLLSGPLAPQGQGPPVTPFVDSARLDDASRGASRPPARSQVGGVVTHWPAGDSWRDPGVPRQRYGWGPLRPVGRVATVAEQRDAAQGAIGGVLELRLHRSHGSRWSRRVDAVWAELVGAGFWADLSYGPAGPKAGWTFGSTAPFHPLDRSGRSFPLWELPLLAEVDVHGSGFAPLEPFLRMNAATTRGPLLLWLPSAEVGLARASDLGRRQGHRVAGVDDLLRWWEAREATRLDWSLEGELLRVQVQVAGPDQVLVLPFEWRGRRLVQWDADADRVTFDRGWRFGRRVRRFGLPPEGSVTLRAHYRAP